MPDHKEIQGQVSFVPFLPSADVYNPKNVRRRKISKTNNTVTNALVPHTDVSKVNSQNYESLINESNLVTEANDLRNLIMNKVTFISWKPVHPKHYMKISALLPSCHNLKVLIGHFNTNKSRKPIYRVSFVKTDDIIDDFSLTEISNSFTTSSPKIESIERLHEKLFETRKGSYQTVSTLYSQLKLKLDTAKELHNLNLQQTKTVFNKGSDILYSLKSFENTLSKRKPIKLHTFSGIMIEKTLFGNKFNLLIQPEFRALGVKGRMFGGESTPINLCVALLKMFFKIGEKTDKEIRESKGVKRLFNKVFPNIKRKKRRVVKEDSVENLVQNMNTLDIDVTEVKPMSPLKFEIPKTISFKESYEESPLKKALFQSLSPNRKGFH